MALPARHRPRSLLPDVSDWFESFPGLWGMGAELGTHGIRIEDFAEENRYVVRAELPGVDPDQNVDITVENHVLTIHAERTEETKAKHRSEFRYGSFTRSVSLPAAAQEDKITASYDSGVLTVAVPLGESPAEGRHIPIQRG